MVPISNRLDHTINFYYELEFNQTHLIQYKYFNSYFLRDRIPDPFNLLYSFEFYEEKEDAYGIYEVEDDFEYLKDSTFYQFFGNNQIDVPYCFRLTKSVRRPINEINILKFNNYLMRHGKRYQTLTWLFDAIFFLHKEFSHLKKVSYLQVMSWKDLFLLYDSIHIKDGYTQFSKLPFDDGLLTKYGNNQLMLYKDIITTFNYKNLLFRHLKDMFPIFSFYIYKVDKQIFKNTRGRSGKYTFIWKYVAPYKRNFIVMFWLIKELKSTPGRSVMDRLRTLLKTLLLKPESMLMFRVKRFSHNYVYRNCKQTLAEHYKTVKK